MHSLSRLLALLLVVAVSSCVGPAEDWQTDTGPTDEYVGEIRKDNSGITASVSLTKSTFGSTEPVTVTLTIANGGRGAVRFLRWLGPSAELEESLFQISRDGRAVEYVGPHYKRPVPTKEDLLTIPPGQSVTQQIVLTGMYDFSVTGAYQVRYEVADLTVTTEYGRKTGTLRSNEVTLWVEGHSIAGPEPLAGGEIITQGAVTYTRCDATQQSLAAQAVTQATTYATGSLNYLNGTPSATQRYTTWFGSFSSSGWTTARTHFTAIQDAFLNKNITIDCGCRKKYYAYVYPTQPYVIYVCNVFWQAPMSGTDSKGGTLIHEMSHFNVVAATDDWAYGQSTCRSLAISDPNKALDNADSHEYFAENTPALP